MSTPITGRADFQKATRRSFLKTAGAAVMTAAVGPTILHATDKSCSRAPILGTGGFQYEPVHGWGELPSHVVWGETHGVAIDEQGLIYIKHRSRVPEPIDAIVVFDPQGRFVRSFGKEYHGGGHGIDIRKENGEEFLYLSDVKNGIVAKSTLKGEVIWRMGRPEEPGIYKDKQNRYSPTNLAFGPDGGFYVGDGYGSHFIHQYDKNAQLVRTWGGKGSEPGKLSTPHGIWLDDRPGRLGPGASSFWKEAVCCYDVAGGAPLKVSYNEPTLVVADRANARLQYFTLDGKHIGFVKDVSFPADIDIRGDIMLVPDLHARVTLFDKNNQVITHLGYDPQWTKKVLERDDGGFMVRRDPSAWPAGRFIHPHDACFDHDGNIFVAEWVPTGRLSLLKKVS